MCKRVGSELLYLALKPTPGRDYQYDYYVVTGSVEKDESIKEGAKREVKEETGLDVVMLIDLKHAFHYSKVGKDFVEHCVGALIDDGKIVLNEEHIDYKWMTKNKFIEKLWWGDDRKELRELIEKTERIIRSHKELLTQKAIIKQ